MTHSALRAHRWQFVLGLIAVGLLGTCIFACFLHAPFYRSEDIGEMRVHVRHLLQGGVPHKTIFSHHMLGYLLLLAIWEVLGLLEPSTVWLASLGTQLLAGFIAALVLRETSSAAAILSSLLVVSVGIAPDWVGPGFTLQSLMLPLLTLYAALLLQYSLTGRRRMLTAAAFSGGFLAICDQRLGILLIPTLTTCASLHPSSWKEYGRAVAAFTAPIAIYILVLAPLGALPHLLHQTIILPLNLRNAHIGSWGQIRNLLEVGIHMEPLMLLATGLSVILLATGSAQWKRAALCSVTLIGSILIYTIAGGRDFLHYLIPLTPLMCMVPALALASPAGI